MGYWEGKCFFCYWIGAIVAIIGLSINTTVKETKQSSQSDTTQIKNE